MSKIDKSGWPDGPWKNETDNEEWVDGNGFKCLVTRGPHGALNGYVAVPSYHHLHGASYDRAYDVSAIEVHGGLTYASAHSPNEKEPDGFWWFGFDTAHAGDINPRSPDGFAEHGYTYKDFAYVKAETISLAEQLAKSTPLKICATCGQEIKRL